MRTEAASDDARAATAAGWRTVWRLALAPPLAPFLAGRVLATLGTWVFRVAAGWAAWELTRSPALLAVATFMLLAPQVLLAPWSGVLADRGERRALLAWTHAAAGLGMAAVALAAALGQLGFPLLLAMLAAVGTAQALNQAALKTMVGQLVPAAELARAVSLNSVVFNLAGFVGPALAGVALAAAGVPAAFALAAALTLSYLFTLRWLPASPGAAGRDESATHQLLAGLRYALAEPLIRLLLALHVASATLARPFLEFVPALVATVLRSGATQAAAVTSAAGLGAVAGGLWLARRDPRRSPLPVVLAAMPLLALTLVALAWSPWFGATLALAFVAGGFMVTRAAAMQTLIQLAARPELRGRAIALYSLVLNAGALAGALALGLLAEWVGLSWGLTIGAVLALAVWLALRRPLERAAAAHPSFTESLA
jgi:MFS family permease